VSLLWRGGGGPVPPQKKPKKPTPGFRFAPPAKTPQKPQPAGFFNWQKIYLQPKKVLKKKKPNPVYY
ncbi:hypothetical protein ACVGV8_02480, partial [Enterobacter intestinihominis]